MGTTITTSGVPGTLTIAEPTGVAVDLTGTHHTVVVRAVIDPDELGRLADRIDNLISAEDLPIPEAIAKQARVGNLTTIRDEMRAMVVRTTGYNPWD